MPGGGVAAGLDAVDSCDTMPTDIPFVSMPAAGQISAITFFDFSTEASSNGEKSSFLTVFSSKIRDTSACLSLLLSSVIVGSGAVSRFGIIPLSSKDFGSSSAVRVIWLPRGGECLYYQALAIIHLVEVLSTGR